MNTAPCASICSRKRTTRIWMLFCFLLPICALLIWFAWTAQQFSYQHPDEPIANGVVSGLIKNRSWDTNWALYDVTDRFRFNQYNFSSYYLFLSMIARLFIATDSPFDLPQMRAASAIFAMLCVFVAYMLGHAMSGKLAGGAAAFLTATSPQLFHDSLYARPESFLTLITLLSCYAAIIARGTSLRLLFSSSLLVGLMIACKISAAPFALVPLAVFLCNAKFQVKPFAVSAVGIVTGMVAGAPAAFLHPLVFLDGTRILLNHYNKSAGNIVDGPLDISTLTTSSRTVYLLHYLLPVCGFLTLLFALVGIVYTIKLRRFDVLIILLIGMFSLLYLGTRAQFYERNFSHCLPIVFVGAGIGLAWSARAAQNKIQASGITVILLGCMVWSPLHLISIIRFEVLPGRFQEKVRNLESKAQSENSGFKLIIWPNLTYGEAYDQMTAYLSQQKTPYLLELLDHDDQTSAKMIGQFLSNYDAVEINALQSPFAVISPSSLQVYLALTHHIYRVNGIRDGLR